MNEMQHARLLLDYSRSFFKGSFKTANKTYSLLYGTAEPSKKMARRNHLEIASCLLSHSSKNYDGFGEHDLLGSISQELRFGNCGQYTSVALKYGSEKKIENIWLTANEYHEFLVLAADPGLKDTLAFNEFCQYEHYNYWVCDPWFNIHCRIHLYGLIANFKSTQWMLQGKEIYYNAYHSELATQWCQRLSTGNLESERMTDSDGHITDNFNNYFSQ